MPKTLKIVCLSDTHTYHDQVKVPEGDLVIHSGDFTSDGRPSQVIEFLIWFTKLPHKHKIFISGNHDVLFEKNPTLMRSLVLDYQKRRPELVYLQDSEIMIEGFRIWGSPWQPAFQGWAFNIKRGQLWKKWRLIPDGIDILVTHGPPSGNLGGILPRDQEEVGDPELLERIQEVHPRIHICGHIHEGYGKREKFGIIFVNGSICDGDYNPWRQPILVDLWREMPKEKEDGEANDQRGA